MTNGSGTRSARVLLVTLSEKLDVWVKKGEIIPRYFNPGEVFDEIHILTADTGPVDASKLQVAVGQAKLTIHPLGEPSRTSFRAAAFRLGGLDAHAKRAVAIARDAKPDLVRDIGGGYAAYLAYRISRAVDVPYIVSLHGNPLEDFGGPRNPMRARIALQLQLPMMKHVLRNADVVVGVYEPLIPFFERLGLKRYEIAYNFVNGAHLRKKSDYALGSPPRIISVGRLEMGKKPESLIRALAELPDVRLTIVGKGVHQEGLQAVARACGVADRVTFELALPNAEICRRLPEFDLFAVHTDHWEISKAQLEAFLTGMPVLVNKRPGAPVPEFSSELVELVDNTPEGYARGIRALLADGARRERLGRSAAAIAWAKWAPERTEERYAEIYRRLLAEGARGAA